MSSQQSTLVTPPQPVLYLTPGAEQAPPAKYVLTRLFPVILNFDGYGTEMHQTQEITPPEGTMIISAMLTRMSFMFGEPPHFEPSPIRAFDALVGITRDNQGKIYAQGALMAKGEPENRRFQGSLSMMVWCFTHV